MKRLFGILEQVVDFSTNKRNKPAPETRNSAKADNGEVFRRVMGVSGFSRKYSTKIESYQAQGKKELRNFMPA